MPHDEYEKITHGLLERLKAAGEPLPAQKLIAEVAAEGHDSARVSFMIADLLTHGKVELDAEQRVRLVQTAVA